MAVYNGYACVLGCVMRACAHEHMLEETVVNAFCTILQCKVCCLSNKEENKYFPISLASRASRYFNKLATSKCAALLTHLFALCVLEGRHSSTQRLKLLSHLP